MTSTTTGSNGTSKIWQWIAATTVGALIMVLGYMSTRIDQQLGDLRSDIKAIAKDQGTIITTQAVIDYRLGQLEKTR